MKTLVATAAALMLAGAAQAQTPPGHAAPAQTPAAPAGDLTRDLNSGPPTRAEYLAPAPVVIPPAATAPVVAPAGPPARAAPPATAPSLPPTQPPVAVVPPRIAPIPATPAPQPRTAPITPPLTAPTPQPRMTPIMPPGAAPAPAPTVPLEAVLAPPPPPAAAPGVTVLDSAARAALPFTADLPPGFEIVTGRPGPDFRIYTIRRGGQSFVMVYAGPASQFPIYSGEMVEAGGRASIVATEGGVRHAMEHLFQRPAAPSEIHVWTMSLDGADRDMAERIAQSVDVR